MGAIPTDIGSAAISGGASVIGSILGYAGQKSANKTNLKIARETNEMNKLIADQANANSYKIFREQLGYNSPINQRKMLEAAGYNPANLYAGSSAAVSAPAAPDQKVPQMQSAQVTPYLGFSQDLAVMGQNLAAIAAARKENAEAKQQELQNEATLKRIGLEFDALGLKNDWQRIENKFKADTYDKNVEYAINQADIALEQKNELHMRNALYEIYGEKEYKAKINQLEEQAKLWSEQGRTEITKQDLNRALGKKAISDAALNAIQGWYIKYKAPSEVAVNNAIGRNQGWQAEMSHEQYKILLEFGRNEKATSILRDLRQAEFSEAATEKAFNELKMINKDLDWYEFQRLCDGIRSFTGALGSAGSLLLLGM